MTDLSDKIAAMAVTLLQRDPNRDAPLELRIAALKTATAALQSELDRQCVAAVVGKALR